ncbi:MAG: glycosyltransferase family 2 protein [Planctomycetota bacterium]|nr:glycosyltransferase family 2 protein [Planctomycetota bacterium]
MAPLISVMMPSYNSARTLPLALASLAAQIYENWECILVDDGSTDNTREIADAFGDPRLKYFRLDRNMGRGAARQKALDEARGDYLCMLDADDWYYPRKLGLQVAVMESEPEIVLASCGMCVLDRDGNPAGVRSGAARIQRIETFSKIGMPPIAHAPCMIRMPFAKDLSYDPSFPSTEDVDFLLRLMLSREYMKMPDVLYVYTEHVSVGVEKVLEGSYNARRMFRKYYDRFPVAARVEVARSYFKSACYRVAAGLGMWEWVIRRRSRRPTEAEIKEFEEARAAVHAARDRLFGSA